MKNFNENFFWGEWGKRGKRRQCSVMDGPAFVYMGDGSAV